MRYNGAHWQRKLFFDDWPSNSKLCFHIVNNLDNVSLFSDQQWEVGVAWLHPCWSLSLHIFNKPAGHFRLLLWVFFYIFYFFSLFDELTSSDFSQTGVMNLLIWTKSERLNLNANDLWLDSDLNLLSWNDLLTSSPSVHRFVVFLTTNTLWISPMPANRMEWSEANSMQKKNTWDHLEPKLGSCPCLELESGLHRLHSPKLSKEAKRQYAFFIPLSFLQTFFIAWPVW